MNTLKVLAHFVNQYGMRKTLILNEWGMFHILGKESEFHSRDILQVAKYCQSQKFVSITENGIRI